MIDLQRNVRHAISQCLPRICLICNKNSHTHQDLCVKCEKRLPWLSQHCSLCAAPLSVNEPDETDNPVLICGQCLKKPPLMECTQACFSYQKPIVDLIIQLKFQGYLPVARLLGNIMAEYLASQYKQADKPDYLIVVPLHRKRLRERGFNQSAELAKPISQKLNITIAYDVVKRQRYTAPQSSTTATQRQSNVKGAFQVVGNLPSTFVAIIDDVVTTGSTLNALCQALKQSGVKRIHAWCCAHA